DRLSTLAEEIGLSRQSIDRLFSVFHDEKDSPERFTFKANPSAKEKNIFVLLQVFLSALVKSREGIDDLLRRPKKSITTEFSSNGHPPIRQLLAYLAKIDRYLESLHRTVDRKDYLDTRKTLKGHRPPIKKRTSSKKQGSIRKVDELHQHLEDSQSVFSNELHYEIACEISMGMEDEVKESGRSLNSRRAKQPLFFNDLWELFQQYNNERVPLYRFKKNVEKLKKELLTIGILLKGTLQPDGKKPVWMEWEQ
ncbi:hypothetical protein KAR91_28005, partial [Candidatus Pacearchaeota archaeon]|nr:hypothetical protein [Candidatus Pacearchaeota archaeon]